MTPATPPPPSAPAGTATPSPERPAAWRRRAERLVRGESPRHPADWWLCGALRLAQVPMCAAVAARTWWYDSGLARIAPEPPGCRVISIGNLGMGGAGKTPLTLALAALAEREGRRVAIVLRGYGGSASAEGGVHVVADGEATLAAEFETGETATAAARFGDEATLYALRTEGPPVVVARDRPSGVAHAARELGAEVVLLDDGFQHRRQARSVDLVLLDPSLRPAAVALFPRGYLREPVAAAHRATALVTPRATALEALLDAKWLGLHPDAAMPILSWDRAPGGWWEVGAWEPGASLPRARAEAAPRGPVYWFAGIAHPERFAASLRAAGCERLAGGRALPDHAPLTGALLERLVARARATGAAAMATTEKDAVRLLGRWPAGAPPLHVLRERVLLRDEEAWRRHCFADRPRPTPPPEARLDFAP